MLESALDATHAFFESHRRHQGSPWREQRSLPPQLILSSPLPSFPRKWKPTLSSQSRPFYPAQRTAEPSDERVPCPHDEDWWLSSPAGAPSALVRARAATPRRDPGPCGAGSFSWARLNPSRREALACRLIQIRFGLHEQSVTSTRSIVEGLTYDDVLLVPGPAPTSSPPRSTPAPASPPASPSTCPSCPPPWTTVTEASMAIAMARAGGHRRHSPQPHHRRPGRRNRQSQALPVRHDRRPRHPAAHRHPGRSQRRHGPLPHLRRSHYR